MVLRSKKNEYRGVNAHLHSYFQAKGGWSSFHSAHINDLAREINRLLPQGYLVDLEQSLQTGANAFQSWEHLAIIIYRMMDGNVFGEAVTRIELLFLVDTGDFVHYPKRREQCIQSNVCLLEINYLHEAELPFPMIVPYPHHPDSYPYFIMVSNPFPDLEQGTGTIYRFSVDEPIPEIDIPLAEGASFRLAVNAVYETTFESLSAYSYRVDYAQLPEHFETYISADQQRIRQVMARAAGN